MKVLGPAAVLLVYVALVALHAPFLSTVTVLVAFPFLLLPPVFRFRARVPARPTIEPYDAGRHGASAHASAFLADARGALEREGFQTVADLALPGYVRGLQTRIVLLERPASGERAVAQAATTPAGLLRPGLCGVDLWTSFADGTRRVTSNVPRMVPLPARAGVARETFTTVRDVARLCRAHRALVARTPGAPPLAEAFEGTPAEQAATMLARGLEEQRLAGTVWLDERSAAYRLTWWGALRSSWYAIHPVRIARARAARRREAELLAMLDVGDRDERPFAVPATAGFPWRMFLPWAALTVIVVLLMPPVPIGGTALRARARSLPADSLQPDVPAPTGFEDATRILEALTHARSRPFVRTDSTGRAAIRPGRVVDAAPRMAELILEKVRYPFTARGFRVIRYEHGFGRGPDRLLLLPTADAYDAVRAAGTDGANYGITTDSIVSWLKGLEREQPFELTGAGTDFVEGRFLEPVHDPAALAERFHAFCPDIVTQGTETVAVLAREMASTQAFFCWWD